MLYCRKCNLEQKWDSNKCWSEWRNPIEYPLCKKDYAWNPSTCPCESDKDCKIDKYLKYCTCVKSPIDNLAIASDEIADTLEIVLIESTDEK